MDVGITRSFDAWRLPLLFCMGWLACYVHCSEVRQFVYPGGQRASALCRVVDKNSLIELSCPHNTWFHVIGKLSSEHNFDSGNCSFLNLPNGTKIRLLMSSSHTPPLHSECRGPSRAMLASGDQICNETVQVQYELGTSDVQSFETFYECLGDKNMFNICEDLTETISPSSSPAGDMYLASPSFFSPHRPQPAVTTCTCNLITKNRFSAKALYLSLSSNPSDDWNITCEECGFNFEYTNNPTVNEVLFQSMGQNTRYTLRIDFRPFRGLDADDNELWISFKGGSSIQLKCNGEGKLATTTSVFDTSLMEAATSADAQPTFPATMPATSKTGRPASTSKGGSSTLESTSGVVTKSTFVPVTPVAETVASTDGTSSFPESAATIGTSASTTQDSYIYIIVSVLGSVLLLISFSIFMMFRRRRKRAGKSGPPATELSGTAGEGETRAGERPDSSRELRANLADNNVNNSTQTHASSWDASPAQGNRTGNRFAPDHESSFLSAETNSTERLETTTPNSANGGAVAQHGEEASIYEIEDDVSRGTHDYYNEVRPSQPLSVNHYDRPARQPYEHLYTSLSQPDAVNQYEIPTHPQSEHLYTDLSEPVESNLYERPEQPQGEHLYTQLDVVHAPASEPADESNL